LCTCYTLYNRTFGHLLPKKQALAVLFVFVLFLAVFCFNFFVWLCVLFYFLFFFSLAFCLLLSAKQTTWRCCFTSCSCCFSCCCSDDGRFRSKHTTHRRSRESARTHTHSHRFMNEFHFVPQEGFQIYEFRSHLLRSLALSLFASLALLRICSYSYGYDRFVSVWFHKSSYPIDTQNERRANYKIYFSVSCVVFIELIKNKNKFE